MGCVCVKNNVTFDWLEEAVPPDSSGDPSHPLLALILTPTRELAIQVNNHIKAVAKYTDVKVISFINIGNIPEIILELNIHMYFTFICLTTTCVF